MSAPKNTDLNMTSDNLMRYPLSDIQQGILFHSLYHDDNAGAYNTQAQIKINTPVNLELLQQAWNEVISRHDILKAHITTNSNDDHSLIIL